MPDETGTPPHAPTRRWFKRIAIPLALLGAAGIGALTFHAIPITHRYYTDADSIREPLETARTRDVLWQPPRPLDELINTAVDDYEPRLSADGMTLYFVRGKAGGAADIYTSVRSADGWSQPQPLLGVNSESDDLGPEPSLDGELLYFYSDRAGSAGGYDLWLARRAPDGWHTPTNLGPAVNSPFNDYGPALTPDGSILYFSSNRPQPDDRELDEAEVWSATLREGFHHRDYDIYCSQVSEHGYTGAQPVTALNSPSNEGSPAVSPFGDFLYFSSDRPGGQGGFDLFRARRLRGAHISVESMGLAVNTPFHELDPGMALGGYAIYFSSDRPSGERVEQPPPAAKDREYDLYYTTSREVFAETERFNRPPIHWAALWSKVGPNLLWALLALFLLLLLLALLRPLPDGRMSLLTKCMLTSLMAHLLLMLLFNVWHVTAAIAGEFRRGGRIQIALSAPNAGDEIHSQIRGALTAIDTPSLPQTPDARQTPDLELSLSAPALAEQTPDRHSIGPAVALEWTSSPSEAAPDTPDPRAEVSAPPQEVASPQPPAVPLPTAPRPSSTQEPRNVPPASTPTPSVLPRPARRTELHVTAPVATIAPPLSPQTSAEPGDSPSFVPAPPPTDTSADLSRAIDKTPSPRPAPDLPTHYDPGLASLPAPTAPDAVDSEPARERPAASAVSAGAAPRMPVAIDPDATAVSAPQLTATPARTNVDAAHSLAGTLHPSNDAPTPASPAPTELNPVADTTRPFRPSLDSVAHLPPAPSSASAAATAESTSQRPSMDAPADPGRAVLVADELTSPPAASVAPAPSPRGRGTTAPDRSLIALEAVDSHPLPDTTPAAALASVRAPVQTAGVGSPQAPAVALPSAAAPAPMDEPQNTAPASGSARFAFPRPARQTDHHDFDADVVTLAPTTSSRGATGPGDTPSFVAAPLPTDTSTDPARSLGASPSLQPPADLPTRFEPAAASLPIEGIPGAADAEPSIARPAASAVAVGPAPRLPVAIRPETGAVPAPQLTVVPARSAEGPAKSLAGTAHVASDAPAPATPTPAALKSTGDAPRRSLPLLDSIAMLPPETASTPVVPPAEKHPQRPKMATPDDSARAPFVAEKMATASVEPTPLPDERRTPAPERSLAALKAVDIRFPTDTALATALVANRIPPPPSDPSALDLPLPRDTAPAPTQNPYVQRTAEDRIDIVKRMGGSEETEKAVADALRWLAAHQDDDGRWDGESFDQGCGGCGGETGTEADRALTGLALLAFLGAGHTHTAEGPYRAEVERGLRFLREGQSEGGDLRGEESMYSHGIAAIALSEAYGMTRDANFATPVRKAAAFIDKARNQRVGGWRYDPGQAGDTSVLGWQVMALKSAHLNGIPVAAESFQAARQWLEKVTDPDDTGRYSYKPGRKATMSMTAEAMFVQQLLGRRRDEPQMQASAAFILSSLPNWKSRPNTYAWYYATLALYQHSGDEWRRWNDALTRELLAHQRKDGPAAGSWDPEGDWADVGGRVYQTALGALMLEIYYRYLPLYTIEPRHDTAGVLQGVITDASSGQPLADTSVRVDLAGGDPVTVTTGPDGRYELRVSEVPDFFATSASRDGYVPGSRNVDAAMLKSGGVTLDFELQPSSDAMVAVEAVPEVHHLGDNRFDGTINSQFQTVSEGSEYAAHFTLKESQVPPAVSSAEVRLLAKGVQRRHRIRINAETLDKRLRDAPEDGSFGEFTASFDPAILRVGENTIEIIAAPSADDIDDFEFVNVRILLSR